MPKSKRTKIISLTRTEKKSRAGKEALVEEVHECDLEMIDSGEDNGGV